MNRTEWAREIATRLQQKGIPEREMQLTALDLWIDMLEETEESAALEALESLDAAHEEGYRLGQDDCSGKCDDAYAEGFAAGKAEAAHADR